MVTMDLQSCVSNVDAYYPVANFPYIAIELFVVPIIGTVCAAAVSNVDI